MNARYEDDLRIAERAAEWHSVLSRTGSKSCGEKECAQFMAWLEESPKHVREFLLLQAWEVETRSVDSRREIAVDEIVRKISANVVPLQRMERDEREAAPASAGLPSPRNRRRWVAGLAAAVALVAVLSWRLYPGQNYSTAIGELRTVELADGSKIELNTGSQVRVEFSDGLRDIQLLQGEALFKVQRDTHRPFRVHSGASVIQAVGTQFVVNRRPLGTVVAVIEGKVRVYAGEPGDTPNILAAGEQVRLDVHGEVQKREYVDDANVAAWRQRKLVFRDDALADIAAEFNRYNRTLQIVVEGAAARNKHYGGIFNADDPESIVRFVAHDGEVSIEKKDGRIVIRGR